MTSLTLSTLSADTVALTGRDRVDLLHRLAANDLLPLVTAGRVAQSLLTTNQGRLIDWLWLVAAGERLLLRTSKGRAPVVRDWIETYTIMEDVQSADVSADFVHLRCTGEASALADALGLAALPQAGGAAQLEGGWAFLGLAALGTGVEVMGSPSLATRLRAAVSQRGGVELDAASVEFRRLSAGVPSPDFEYAEQVHPLELRLGQHAVSFSKGCYVGQEVLNRLDSYDKVARLLVGLRGAAVEVAPGARLFRDGQVVGKVTSAARSGGELAALAIVKREAATPGPAQLEVGAEQVSVEIVDRPFWL